MVSLGTRVAENDVVVAWTELALIITGEGSELKYLLIRVKLLAWHIRERHEGLRHLDKLTSLGDRNSTCYLER